MNIEITDLDMILNYLETTSLEPHDDYTSEFTYKDQKILYKHIKQLQQENKKLKDNWNKLREYIVENNKTLCWTNNYDAILGKMEELQGSDNNDTNR